MSTMFSEYAETPYVIEPVRINFADGTSRVTPDLAPRRTTASAAYINSVTGFAPALPSTQVADLLVRMSLGASVSPEDADVLLVDIPPTRPDILHECDVMEDAAVAYGFNNIAKTFPRAITVGAPLPLNKLADIVRKECAQAGWVEVLPYILCAHAENFAWLNRPDPGNLAIALANPKTVEYQVVRTSLLPGLLKTLRENKKLPLPVRIFEVSDVAVQDASQERKARNERKVAGLWCNKTAGFEVVHGLLDRIMQILGVAFIERKESTAATGYYIQETTSTLTRGDRSDHSERNADLLDLVADATFFPGRVASIFYRPPPAVSHPAPLQDHLDPDPAAVPASAPASGALETMKETLAKALPALAGKAAAAGGDLEIGVLGILHPEVLAKFEIDYPCSSIEFDLQPFL